jgi:hypothetical protein
MKLYAGRPQDIQDIHAQIEFLTAGDLAFMRAYLRSPKLPLRRHIKPDQLERAFVVLAEMEKETPQ